jgi:sugar lactone lactonase YvrE
VDGGGNVYVADDYNHALKKIPAGCTSSSCVITLGGSIYIYEPTSVAVDGGGNVYLTDWGDGSVKEIPIGCVSSSCVTRLGGPYYKPSGVAVDGQGNVYVADESWGDVVYEMPPGCASSTCMTALGGSGGLDDVFTNPWGLAVDASGNVYVANYGNQYGSWAVFEMPPRCYSSNCVTSLGGGFQSPTSVAVDASGNVYVSDVGDSVVKKMPAGCASSSCVTILGSGFYYAEGVAVDGSGNVYIADTNNNRVLKEDFADPPSLAFAAATDGATSADSPQTVTVENVGNAALSFPIPSTGNNPSISANFTLNSGGASACQVEGSATSTEATLAPGATCDLYISFAPEAVGTLSGSLVLTDNNLNAATPGFTSQSIALSGTAIQATQTIAFPSPQTQMVGTPLTLSATASSGLPVSFTSTTASICQVSGDVATFISSGTCAIASDQAGNTDYAAASQVTESFPVNSPALASLLSPAPGLATTLGTTNVAFTWTTAVGATGYQLNLSAVGPGQSELFLYKGTATAATVTSLPPNGAEVYVTLYTKISGVWQSNSYMYYESGPRPAALTSPTPGPGTILGTSNITFQWNTGAEVSEYQLNLSAIASGDSDLYSYKGTALTATVPTLPANGVNIYATLSSKINGVWQSNSYVYTESGTPAPALLTSPTPGIGTRTGFSSVTFQWTSGVDVTSYQLNLSAIAAGDSELYSYKGTATSTIVPTLPANGVELYARLYSLINGAWQYKDYVYTEDGIPLAAALTWPTPGLSTILGTSNVNFLWTGGTAVSEYQLSLSAIAPGDSDLFSYKGTATTTIAPTLPADALKVYARLYSKITGTWQYNDYVYTESGTPTPAALTSPTPGLSTILGIGNVAFQWTAGVAVTNYQLSLSAIAAGDSELFLYKGSALNTTVPRLPANGVKVYARLYSYINGVWQYNDYVYTEQ